MGYITVEDVRNFMMDRSLDDNELLMDLAYSDEEIQDGMRRAAREFNSVPPFSQAVEADCLPDDTNIFLYATAEQLCISTLSKLRRNDQEYNAGDMAADATSKRIQHLQAQIKEYRERWREVAHATKVAANLRRAYLSF